ncbi:MAG: hypothetical protein V1799_05655 [bacterium]
MHLRLQMYLILLLLTCIFIDCSSDDPQHRKPQAYHQLGSLNALLLKELSKSRVVMFYDSYPGHITFSHCVTTFLESWLNRLQQSPSDTVLPRTLFLALELGQPGESNLNEYLRTGDRYPLMRFLVDEEEKYGRDVYLTRRLSVDYLQFCERLRLVRIRIDSLNRQYPNISISLNILGPEAEPPYSYLDIRSKSRDEFITMKLHWDAFKRDSESSSRLAQYLVQHPNHKLLVFSNSMHLARDTKYGYYLARHLDSLVGRLNVSVFATSRLLGSPVSSPQIEEYNHDTEAPDFLVRKAATPPYPFPFYLVKSQNTFRALIDLAEQYDASPDTLEKDLSRKMLSHALTLLRRSHLVLDPSYKNEITSLQTVVASLTRKAIMTPQTFTVIRRLISRFDPVRDVLEIDSIMTTFTPSTDYENTLATVIYNLPGAPSTAADSFRVTIPQGNQVDAPTAHWSHMWKQRKSERQIYMLLQILWFGTPSETANAMKALQRETGHDFVSASQWEDWYQSTR